MNNEMTTTSQGELATMNVIDLQQTNIVSSNTMRAYHNAIRDFFNVDDVSTVSVDQLRNVTVSDANEWARQLRERGLKDSTINAKLAGMWNLYQYLKRHDIGLVTYNPFDTNEGCVRYKNAISNYSHQIALSHEQVKSMIDVAKTHKGILGLRDQLIISVLCSTGVRREELCNMKFSDIQYHNGHMFVSIIGKGSKERLVGISDVDASDILIYADTRGFGVGEDKYIFVSHSSNSVAETKLSEAAVYKMIKKVAAQAGIDPKLVSPHTFRHTYATDVHKNTGVSDYTLQELMGHTQFNTTKRYIHAQDIIDQCPANQLAMSYR